MCIALLTTAHPKYALIVLNNRDEFILRPTSQPHWWTIPDTSDSETPAATITPATNQTPAANGDSPSNDHNDKKVQHVLSSRDLYRPERGTWMGITKAGHFAVLTNYRELDSSTGAPSVSGTKSRGSMVTAWLGNSTEQSVADFVEGMIADGSTQGVGGFSLLCGKLRRRRQPQGLGKEVDCDELEPLAIVSNKAVKPDQIPWVCESRDEVIGLSNAAYDHPDEWPKVTKGKALLKEEIKKAVAEDATQEDLLSRLFGLLDQDDLPRHPNWTLEDYLKVLQQSIFVPLLGDQQHKDDMAAWTARSKEDGHVSGNGTGQQGPPQPVSFSTGLYGTQRQTVILVDWDGNVTYAERSLSDADGKEIEKGKGDSVFRFAIEGWH
ncbi:NRDE protein-domain-containing protein [Coniella lustricola]|uniref:NRDE protein-domain-containing protein n=1 Tax=Coniella lustricola TaxID=2025994 RepID=A0A2T2ZWT2_9PEZI|nr:NRDE protein-domain-containing protein [Coniella lustricola]